MDVPFLLFHPHGPEEHNTVPRQPLSLSLSAAPIPAARPTLPGPLPLARFRPPNARLRLRLRSRPQIDRRTTPPGAGSTFPRCGAPPSAGRQLPHRHLPPRGARDGGQRARLVRGCVLGRGADPRWRSRPAPTSAALRALRSGCSREDRGARPPAAAGRRSAWGRSRAAGSRSAGSGWRGRGTTRSGDGVASPRPTALPASLRGPGPHDSCRAAARPRARRPRISGRGPRSRPS